MNSQGDLKSNYEFSGLLGSSIQGSSAEGESPCEVSALFRKAQYRQKKSLETWLTFICTFGKQKHTYKPYRFYLDLNADEQKIVLPYLDENLKKVQLSFEKISLKKSK